jgi:hypothetical protein
VLNNRLARIPKNFKTNTQQFLIFNSQLVPNVRK